jgi:hypothetical protein
VRQPMAMPIQTAQARGFETRILVFRCVLTFLLASGDYSEFIAQCYPFLDFERLRKRLEEIYPSRDFSASMGVMTFGGL